MQSDLAILHPPATVKPGPSTFQAPLADSVYPVSRDLVIEVQGDCDRLSLREVERSFLARATSLALTPSTLICESIRSYYTHRGYFEVGCVKRDRDLEEN